MKSRTIATLTLTCACILGIAIGVRPHQQTVDMPFSNHAYNLSDRNAKANFQAVNPKQILEALQSVPIETWNYKSEKPSIRHIGPAAQDFFKAFQVGEDDRHIAAVDGDGVLMASIQGLTEVVKEKDRKIEVVELALKDIADQNKELKKSLDQLSTRLLNIEQQGKY